MAAKGQMLSDLLYGDLLASPGYDVDFAVGTTYSLDLKAMLIVPYSLGAFGDLSNGIKSSPLFLLESIRRSSDKFALFCHRGGIHSPKELQSFYSLLEDSIFEVVNKESPLSNFHPKMWLIKEVNHENKNDKQLKVIILSKNMDFDNNIDVVVSLTGKIDMTRNRKNYRHTSLSDFVLTLSDYIYLKGDKNRAYKKQKVEEMADDLLHVSRFEVDENRFEPDEYEFIPFFQGENLNDRVVYPDSFQGQSMMVISPFIDEKTISDLNSRVGKNGRNVLVTRYGYVSPNIFDYYNRENGAVYIVNDQMINNEYVPIDLHAKTYFVSWPKNESGYYIYLGSANATYSAFHKNTELLVRLKLKNGQLLFDNFEKEFLQIDEQKGESLLYEQLKEANEHCEAHEYSPLEKYTRKLLCSNFKATVTPNSQGLYDVLVKAPIKKETFSLSISPLQMPTFVEHLEQEVVFKNIPLSKLSEFYLIKGTNDGESIEEVIKIPTKGIPEERNAEIFRSIVDSRDKFYNYISFMLCDDPEEYFFELEQLAKQLKGEGCSSSPAMTGRIYEQMLKISASNPEQLNNLEDVLRIVKNQSFAQDFLDLYAQFQAIIPKLKKLHGE